MYKPSTAANAEIVAQVTGLRLMSGGGERDCYIDATLLNSNGTSVTGPVCGSVDTLTGKFACYSCQRVLSTE